MTDLEVPTAPPGLQKEPALIIGLVGSLAAGLITLIGLGQLNDGLQWVDVPIIVGPLLLGLASRQLTFPQATVDLLAPRTEQRKAVAARKR